MKCLCILWFTVTHHVLKGFNISLAHGSFNCKNFQNITCARESWNAVMFRYSPLHIPCFIVLIVQRLFIICNWLNCSNATSTLYQLKSNLTPLMPTPPSLPLIPLPHPHPCNPTTSVVWVEICYLRIIDFVWYLNNWMHY